MKPVTPKTELSPSTQLRKAVVGGSHVSFPRTDPCFTSLLSRLVCCLWCLLPTIPTAAVQLQYESQSSSIAYSMTAFADVGGVTDLQSWQGSGFLDNMHTIVAQAGKMVVFVPYVAVCSAGLSVTRLETEDARSDGVACVSVAQGTYDPAGNWRATVTFSGTLRWSVVPSQGEPGGSGPTTLMLMPIVTNSTVGSVSGTWTLRNLTITVRDQVWGPYTCALNLSSGVLQGTIPPQSITNGVTTGDTISVSFQTDFDCSPTGGPMVPSGATEAFTIIATLTSGSGSVGGCSDGILVNAGFEGGTNANGIAVGWTGYQRAPNPTTVWSIQTASPPAGGGLQYQQILNTSSAGGAGVRQDVTGCIIGATYSISGWMRGNSDSATCTVKCSPSASTSWATAIDLNPPQMYTGPTWTPFSGTVVATGTNMTIWLDGHTGGSGLNKAECFDSVTVSCTTMPPLHFDSITLQAPNQLRLVLGGGAGSSVTIQRSSNLVDWLTLTNLVLTSGTVEFTDTSTANASQRFYRATSP